MPETPAIAAPQPRRPPITANQVTLLRMALLPIPCAMALYGPASWMWLVVVLYTILGFTDLLDGWMARRYGPTVLGALLDPVADKVFMVAALAPMSALGLVHPAIVIVMIMRDFLITSLRSAMSLRGVHVKTSVLAKLKTAVQMGGVGIVVLVHAFPDDSSVLLVTGALAAAAAGIVLWRYRATRRISPFVFVPCGLTVLAFVLRLSLDQTNAIRAYWAVILLFTVASAADYLGGAWTVLSRGRGRRLQDLARLLWTTAAGAGLPWLLYRVPEAAPVWVVILSTEFATGAVDNLRCHEGFLPHLWIFPLRAAALVGGGAAVLQLPRDGAAWNPAFWAGLGLAVLMLLWTVLDFIVARRLIWGEEAPAAEQAKGSVGR